MRLEINPDAPRREAEAIAKALALAVGAKKDDSRTPWWRAGVRANLTVEPEPGRRAG